VARAGKTKREHMKTQQIVKNVSSHTHFSMHIIIPFPLCLFVARAFSATESIESAVILQLSKTLVLSPQDVVDCTPNPLHCGGTGGCNGATPELAFDWVGENGIALDSAYPYKGKTGTCQNVTRSVRVGSWSKIAPNDAQSLMEAVATYGPISVSVAASPWGSYSSGIYTGCPTTDIDINHAVQLVGYGTENGTGYWIVRNSWGASWGEAGYIRLYRGTKEVCGDDNTPSDGSGCTGGPDKITVCGSCGIWYDNSFPLDVLLL
jgi:cathepsin L